MIETKLFEVRDRITFIPVIATRMTIVECGTYHTYCTHSPMKEDDVDAERYLLRRAGYAVDDPVPLVVLVSLLGDGQSAHYDPYGWRGGARTYPVAHHYVQEHWDELSSGDVVDVEFILGETAEPKVSERER